MLNKIKEWSGVVAVLILVIGIFLPGAPTNRLGNATASYVDAAQGFRVNGTEVISSSGVFDGTVSSTALSTNSLTLSGGTAQTKFSCATTTWNPGSIASSGAPVGGYVTSTDIALTGAVMGDTCASSLTSATSSGLSTDCTVTGAATATIALYNISGAAIDPATGTAKVCFSH